MQTAISLSNLATVKRSSLYGSLSARFVAFLADTTLLIFLYSLFLYAVVSSSGHMYTWKELLAPSNINLSETYMVLKLIFFNLYFPITHWLYYTLLEASPKQATIGKFTLGLRVTDIRGRRITFAQANLRYFSKLASAIPVFMGFLLLLTTRRSQMLHDYMARTVVVAE